MSEPTPKDDTTKVKVWDLPLRVFHWALAIGFVVSYVSVKTDNMEIHIVSAMCLLGLLVFRLIWGVVGSYNARFQTFLPSFRKIVRYLKGDDNETAGHSPIGALSVFALLIFLTFQLMTGLVADDEIYITGPLRDFVDSDMASWATSTHARLSEIFLALVVLHIVAILFYWVVKRNNLIIPMITGYKSISESGNRISYANYNKGLAALIIVFAALIAYGVFNWV